MRDLVGDSLLERTRSSVVLHGGQRYRYPLELDDVLRKYGSAAARRALGSYGRERLHRAVAPAPDRSFEDWVDPPLRRELYADFFGPYTEKLWGIAPTQISADWASQRISLPSLADVLLRLVGAAARAARAPTRAATSIRGLGIGQIFER